MTRLRTFVFVIGLAVGHVVAHAQPIAPPLSLKEALARAAVTAPRLRAAETRARAAEHAAAAAGRWRSPTLDVSVENLGAPDLDHDGLVWITPGGPGFALSTSGRAAHAVTRSRVVGRNRQVP